jgi:hypothetical protein
MTTKEKQLENTLTWYTYYVDYIEKHFYNIHNEAAEFSDDRQKLENEFLKFPELEEEEEEEEENTCYECGEEIEQEDRFCSKECYNNSFNERI